MAVAITSTSGTWSHGEPVTITGSGFGTKSPAAPFHYDDFAGGTVGNDLTGYSFLSTGSAPVNPQYEGTIVRGVHARAAKCSFLGDQTGCSFITGGFSVGSGQPLYVACYLRHDFVSPYPPNYKILRVAPDGAPAGHANTYWNTYDTTGNQEVVESQDVSTGVFADRSALYTPRRIGDFTNTWKLVELYFVRSTAAVADGTTQMWHDGTAIVSRVGDIIHGEVGDNAWAEVRFGHNLEHGSYGDALVYFSQVYVDTTPARALLGNAATFAASTHRELLVPSAWSATAITATVDQGTFAADETAYLYVVDSTGAVNGTGFAVTIGAASATAPQIGRPFSHRASGRRRR